MPDLSSRLERTLHSQAAEAQRRWRAPNVSVGVVQDGELVWSSHIGSARLEPPTPATDATQGMVGSITKTFTAVLVMQLRDEGLLALDDPLGTWLPESSHAALTVRQLLSHTSGLQREPLGRIWETFDAPESDRLLADLERARSVLPPHLVFHYSNLAYAVLGHLVERLRERPWETVLRERILRPLGMAGTALVPADDHAYGYQVHPFAGTARREPEFESRALAPLGGLWSSVADMARYAAFVADPDPVLDAETMLEMCRPVVMTDLESWTRGYGLGYELVRSRDRVYAGHRGAMPGFLSGMRVARSAHTGAFVIANVSAGAEAGPLATRLLDTALDDAPRPVSTWVPERPQPDLDELLGAWWSEGEELAVEIREGELWMRVVAGSPQDSTRFVRESPSRFRAVDGRERGEALELARGEDGSLTKLYFATYPVTRDPLGFNDLREE